MATKLQNFFFYFFLLPSDYNRHINEREVCECLHLIITSMKIIFHHSHEKMVLVFQTKQLVSSITYFHLAISCNLLLRVITARMSYCMHWESTAFLKKLNCACVLSRQNKNYCSPNYFTGFHNSLHLSHLSLSIYGHFAKNSKNSENFHVAHPTSVNLH